MNARPQFTQEQIDVAKRTVQIVSEAHGDYPYHESVTPDDIRGHTLRREDVRLSYRTTPGAYRLWETPRG